MTAVLDERSMEPAAKAPPGVRYDPVTAALVVAALVDNVLIITGIRVPWLLPVAGLSLAVGLPMRLVARVAHDRIRGPGTRWALSLAIVLLGLILGGLLVNEVLPLVGDSHPLGQLTVLETADLIVLTIIAVRPAALRAPRRHGRPTSGLERGLVGGTAVAVVASVLGAVRLNNGAGAELSVAALIVAGAVLIVLLTRLTDVRPAVVALCIFGVSLAILWMTSLRGWYTTGHDIQSEFRVFTVVRDNQRWSVGAAHDSYNACLSLTILPQMLWQVTRAAAPYVFKVDFPAFFAIVPVVVYEMSRRMLGPRRAVAAAIVFISFPTFVNDMVFLNRQEIAFLFAAVALAIAGSGGRPFPAPRTLVALMLLGMVLSHYSTSYVFLAVCVIGLVANWLTNRLGESFGARRWVRRGSADAVGERLDRMLDRQERHPPVLGLRVVLVLLLAVGGWTLVTAQASGQFTVTLTQSLQALVGTGGGGKSSDVNYSILPHAAPSPAQALAQYRRKLEARSPAALARDGVEPTAVTSQYPTPPGPSLDSPPNAVGRQLAALTGVSATSLNGAARSAASDLLQLLAVVGMVAVLLGWRRSGRVTAEIFFLGVGSLVVLAATVVLPVLSVNYSLLREFQQALLILAPFVVVGASVVLWPLGRMATRRGVSTLAMLFYLSLTGLLPQLTGGYAPQLNLNNAGEYYENYYTQPQELSAVEWLDSVGSTGQTVQADPFAAARFQPYTTIGLDPDNFPLNLRRDSLVILGGDTVTTGIDTEGVTSGLTDYRYPTALLDRIKQRVYASDGAAVYAP